MLTVLATEPFHKFSIPIKSEEHDSETVSGLRCNLTFTYTAKYPEELPSIEMESLENVDEQCERRLLEYLNEQVTSHFVFR